MWFYAGTCNSFPAVTQSTTHLYITVFKSTLSLLINILLTVALLIALTTIFALAAPVFCAPAKAGGGGGDHVAEPQNCDSWTFKCIDDHRRYCMSQPFRYRCNQKNGNFIFSQYNYEECHSMCYCSCSSS